MERSETEGTEFSFSVWLTIAVSVSLLPCHLLSTLHPSPLFPQSVSLAVSVMFYPPSLKTKMSWFDWTHNLSPKGTMTTYSTAWTQRNTQFIRRLLPSLKCTTLWRPLREDCAPLSQIWTIISPFCVMTPRLLLSSFFSELLWTLGFWGSIGQHIAQCCLFQKYERSVSSLVVFLKIFMWERAQ